MCRTTNNQHTPTNRLTDTGGIQRTPRGSPSMQRLRLASASIMQDRDGDNRVVAASLLGRSPQPLGEFSDTFSRLVSLYEEREGPTPRSMGGQAVANFGAKAYLNYVGAGAHLSDGHFRHISAPRVCTALPPRASTEEPFRNVAVRRDGRIIVPFLGLRR